MKIAGEVLPVMLSTGVGVGVLAGVVSGVCFLVYNGLAWSRRVKKAEKIKSEGSEKICSSCSSPTIEECSSCSLPVCSECSLVLQGVRRCQYCTNDRLIFTKELRSGNNFLRLLKDNLSFGYWSDDEDNLNRTKVTRAIGADKNSEETEKKKEEESKQVREFLQVLAERLTGGSLDDVSITKMYHHPEYLPSTVGPSASSSHAKLQHLVQRVIEEALKLPALLDYSGIQRDSDGRLPEFNPKTYEELLTTAILNKVIDRYQHDNKRSNGASSSGVHSGSSSPGEFGRGRRRRSVKKNNTPSISPEPSSLEPMSHDDYGHSDSSGHVSDTPVMIEECNIERTVYSTDDDDYYTQSYDNPVDGALSNINFKSEDRVSFPEYGGDIVDKEKLYTNSRLGANQKMLSSTLIGNSEIYTNDKSWEENWLFQKKKIKPSQSVPVPMLIPNPNTEYRAMIGDRDAEDTTDLSDVASDLDDDDPSDIKHVLVNSKTIIGGKNPEIVIEFDETNNFVELEPFTIKNKLYKDENENNEYHPKEDLEDIIIEIPKTDTKDTIKCFLKSLESDGRDYVESFKPSDAVEFAEATNLDVVDSKENTSHESLENQQQESEYTETVTVPVQRHLDSLKRQHNIPPQSNLIIENNDEETEISSLTSALIPNVNSDKHDVESIIPLIIEEAQNSSQNEIHEDIVEVKDNACLLEECPIETNNESSVINCTINTDGTEDVTDEPIFSPIPGSIAEREHKKWMNAIPMENNPYSPEAIESRLNKQKHLSLFDTIPKTTVNPTIVKEVPRSTPNLQQVLSQEIKENVRYGRDYYINQAKNSAGTRMKFKQVFDFNGNAFSRSGSVISNEGSCNNSEGDLASPFNDNDVYVATPILVDDDVELQFDEIYKSATKIDAGENDIYILPIDLNDKNHINKLLDMTNGMIIQKDELMDQSDSISSVDEQTRIYNIDSGKVIHTLQDDLLDKPVSKFSDTKMWKSSGDVYTNIHKENNVDLRTKEDIDLPSVKDLAKKFFEQAKEAGADVKPKRKLSRDMLEDEYVTNQFNNKASVKQPQYMHSLTARSISKEFRDELKLSMPCFNNKNLNSCNSITNGIEKEEPLSEIDQVPEPGSIRNKLAFFESLSNAHK